MAAARVEPGRAARPAACPAAAFEGTILQLLRRDAGRPPRAWAVLMQELRRMGLRSVTLQWSSIDTVDFYRGRPGATEVLPLLPVVLRAAHDAGLRSWLGLHHDGAWWQAAGLPDEALDAYLAARIADLEQRVPALRAAVAGAPVAGWYVSDELDDATWQAPEREAALTRYLGQLRSRLEHAAPGRPVAVSAFANHAQSAAEYGAQLGRIGAASGIERLLLQDGVGAGKSTVEQAHDTAQGVAAALRGSAVRLGMIVELFEIRKKTTAQDAATVPAPLAAIQARIAASAGAGDLPLTSFSHAHHLSAFGGAEAAARGAEWRRGERCGPF